ncbi:MAG TPA: cupin domain-containing protein [Solirubrobacteraceae bacterium]|nr:cupin domain-containing protein [Solirubrobacteraceae bacterium]
MKIVKAAEVEPLDRGDGIRTIPLITRHSDDTALITTGISSYPAGTGAPLHVHNCDEQVTLLSGTGEVEIDGDITPLVPYDSTYIPEGRAHAFRNTGSDPMTILWIYPTQKVTRTLMASGETVEHLSDRDMMGRGPA